MIPRISPKKTWEGTVGGMLFAVGGSWCACRMLPGTLAGTDGDLRRMVVLGLLLGGAAVIGDLAESLVKREAGVKDSSTILPGHGGCLDMIDSLLFTAPLLYVYMRLVLGDETKEYGLARVHWIDRREHAEGGGGLAGSNPHCRHGVA